MSRKSQGKRHLAREMALRMLYQIDLGGVQAESAFGAFDASDFLADGKAPITAPGAAETALQQAAAEAMPKKVAAARSREVAEERRLQVETAFEHARELVSGTLAGQAAIDEMIRQQADNWRLERMSPVDRNILRLAVYEMLREVDVPKLVIVDEAIELAKKYGSENSGRFVNGLLDGLLKRHEFPGTLK
jgi:N utilization substance protein B